MYAYCACRAAKVYRCFALLGCSLRLLFLFISQPAGRSLPFLHLGTHSNCRVLVHGWHTTYPQARNCARFPSVGIQKTQLALLGSPTSIVYGFTFRVMQLLCMGGCDVWRFMRGWKPLFQPFNSLVPPHLSIDAYATWSAAMSNVCGIGHFNSTSMLVNRTDHVVFVVCDWAHGAFVIRCEILTRRRGRFQIST